MGDCGPGVMAHFQGLKRNETSWQLIRNQIADFLLAAAEDKDWHDIFAVCDERPPLPPAEPAVPVAGPTAALVVDDEPEDLGGSTRQDFPRLGSATTTSRRMRTSGRR